MERRQPIVIGINEKGEMIWSDMEMPRWQRAMFPIHYTGDFGNFWAKLSDLQKNGRTHDDVPNFSGFRSFVPGTYGAQHAKRWKRPTHQGD